MIQSSFTNLLLRSRISVKSLPALFHLILFLFAVMVAILSFNFEVFRVMRIGDLVILVVAFFIGVHWYGHRMQEEGYKHGIQKATESNKSRKIK